MRLVLIRHAHSEANAAGILSGRLPNIHLSSKGRTQALDLADRLGIFPIKELRVSPMERCMETILPWLEISNQARSKPIKAVPDDGISEVDYGKWSGRKLSALSKNKLWRTVQESPSRMYFPDGEGIGQMQARAMATVHQITNNNRTGVSIVVSHGDVIKSIVASALGQHLDDFQRIIIDPASVSIIDFSQMKPRIILLNDTRGVVTELLLASKRSANLLGGGAGK